MPEKFYVFLEWWYSVFADWNARRMPYYANWFIPEDMMDTAPKIWANFMLLVFACMILSLILMLITEKGKVGNALLIKLIAIPVAFLALLGLFFASNLAEGFLLDLFRTAKKGFTEEIPKLWGILQAYRAGADIHIGDAIFAGVNLAVDVIAMPILTLIAVILGIVAVLVCLSPIIGMFVAECALFKFAAPIHFLADLGGGMLMVVAAMVAILCASFYMLGVMLLLYLVGGVMIRPLLKVVTVVVDNDPYS